MPGTPSVPKLAAPACRHHWIVESPNGPTSHGRCRRCGEEREFTNAHGDQWLVPAKADAILIARVKREEAALYGGRSNLLEYT